MVGERTTCHACGMAKACRAQVAKLTTTKADKIGERFFVDATGPFAGVAARSKYLFGAIDDYSGKLFMMFGARKSDLKDFVEKLFSRMKVMNGLPTYVRLDGGGENMAVRKRCCDKGIKVELTPENRAKVRSDHLHGNGFAVECRFYIAHEKEAITRSSNNCILSQ